MTDSTRFIGPRGWAVLVLAGGAALSVPFLRNPGSVPHSADAFPGMAQEVDLSNTSWPDLREKALTPSGQTESNLSKDDWAELARLQNNKGEMPRKVTGKLPSTSGSPLPSWADRGPRVDQLVNDSIRTEPLAPAATMTSTGLDPLRPWMGHGMKTSPEGQFDASDASNLRDHFAIASPNPDARWSSVPSATANSDLGPHDSGALASNQPLRKFEDHVKQWPDEKQMPSPIQVAWDTPRSPQLERNAASSNPNRPSASQPSGFQMTGQNGNSSSVDLTPNVVQSAQPDSVTAPMVSSQSNRLLPRVTSPTIESPKPSTTSPPPKHFIQQPKKRA